LEFDMSDDAMVYWQAILDFENRQAAELRDASYSVMDDNGNDITHILIKRHQEKARAAKHQIDALKVRQNPN
jgi:hypothetical protein